MYNKVNGSHKKNLMLKSNIPGIDSLIGTKKYNNNCSQKILSMDYMT